MGFLSSLFGLDAGKATQAAAGKNSSILDSLQKRGNEFIKTGEQKSAGALNSAIDLYDPYTSAGTDALSLYTGALGLDGAGGTAAAADAFKAGPGYQFAMDQGTQAALRGASAAGMLNSGNTLTELTKFGQGLADQEYGSWLDRLSGVSNNGLAATGSQAGIYGGLANLYQGTADDRLSLASGVSQGRMGVNNQTAQGKEANAAAFGNLGGSLLSGGIKLATGGLF